ncbi:hypothetical protein L210DRAFT_3402320 [Boletus edulis BED1]|uniref:Reverse transcriptase domain-containing protein n=1 Tax=Boletus edulis BED1 TaxID=1328754 RepID=A0AAD4BTM8_BOLED|nr:hypothetical protein L210DRAFT_3402320 [Boletus edulis BED1]
MSKLHFPGQSSTASSTTCEAAGYLKNIQHGTNKDQLITQQRWCSTTSNQTPTGLDQGCPISPIAFLFYNASLIELTGKA